MSDDPVRGGAVTRGRVAALEQPLEVGPRTMRNRIVQAPLSVNYQDSTGQVTDRTVEHYARRARGGAGMVITENFAVDDSGRQLPLQGMASGPEYLPGLTRLAEAIKAEGALAVLELVHAGRYAGPWDQYEARRRLAPSAVSFELLPGRHVTPSAMTTEDIDGVVGSFAAATTLAVEAGWDGVHIHGAQGFLLSQFLSLRMNTRDDAYGGSPEARRRLPLEVVDAVVAAGGGRLAVGYHLLSDELMPGGYGVHDAAALAGELAGHGVDFLIPVPTTFESMRSIMADAPGAQPMMFDPAAVAPIVAATSIPVFANGHLGDPVAAETLVASGAAAAIALGRPVLADPDWPAKVLAGRHDDVVRCACSPPTCLRTQLTGVVCHSWQNLNASAPA